MKALLLIATSAFFYLQLSAQKNIASSQSPNHFYPKLNPLLFDTLTIKELNQNSLLVDARLDRMPILVPRELVNNMPNAGNKIEPNNNMPNLWNKQQPLVSKKPMTKPQLKPLPKLQVPKLKKRDSFYKNPPE